MKAISKHIIYLITLAVLSNGVFAAQMSLKMMDVDSAKSVALKSEPSCHGDDVISEELNTEQENCCDIDCTGCVTSSQYLQPPQLFSVSVYFPTVSATLSTHLLPQHSSNLFRPPILI